MQTKDNLADRALELLLGLEAKGVETLDTTTRDVVELVSKDGTTSLDGALDAIQSVFSAAVVELRLEARIEAAKSIAAEIGLTVAPSGADDTERGEKAAAYYAKAWLDGLGELGWPAGAQVTSEVAAKALADVACFEVFDAWNDEHSRTIPTLTEKAAARWTTKRDGIVCPNCEALDKKTAGRDGLFELPGGKRGRPPLHKSCRCVVVTDAGKAAEETQAMDIDPIISAAQELERRHSGSEGRILLRQNGEIEVSTRSPAKDASPIFTKALHVKAIDEIRRTVDFVASTDVVDAHDEIVDQGSWRLDDYLKNPVVLFAHNSRELPIGRSVDVAVRNVGDGMQLECRIEFATADLNPLADQVFRMVVGKFLRAVSVGFVPKSYRWEMRGGVEVWVWADCVLKEISVTPVPANPEALAKMKALAPSPNKSPSPASPGSKPATADGQEAEERKQMDLKDLQEKLAANATTIAELRLEAKTASETAEKAEAERKRAVESLLASEAKVKALETDKAALDAQAATLTADRDAEKERAEKAESTLIDQDVDKLVGKKITAAEKPLFVDLRKSNPTLFAKMVEQRQDLRLDEVVTEKNATKNGAPESFDTAKTIELVESRGSS
jgi:HK97 family phage prohead protease